LQTPITAIVGNPPYSVGQTSANDNNANMRYPTLDSRIEQTYAARSTATNKNSLYDSYIRAIRWATDRIGDHGIVAYVTNGGWIDGNTADGIRLTLADEFASLYVYNLRGNQRTAGEQSRKEGGKVFGAGSRATVAILIAVKNPKTDGPCQIYYRDIGDYLTTEQKLAIVDDGHLSTVEWQRLTPNVDGDWVQQRSDVFARFTPIASKGATRTGNPIFDVFSPGLQTNRDAWVYNFSRSRLGACIRRTLDSFNSEVLRYSARGSGSWPEQFVDRDPTKISWSSSLLPKVSRGRQLVEVQAAYRHSMYRPFNRLHVYFNRDLNHRPGQLDSIFPIAQEPNLGMYLVGPGSDKPFSVLMTALMPDLAMWGSSNGQYLPRWTYESTDVQRDLLSDDVAAEDDYRRVDNISDAILAEYRKHLDPKIIKDDIFFYVYGLLHSPQYRDTFVADLKKMLPRIPRVAAADDFHAFANVGRRLADLHVGYESVDPYPLTEEITGPGADDMWRVTKMRWRSKSDHSAIVYNGHLTLTGIPDEAHRYLLGSRTAVDWLIDRYQIKTDKASGIVNDPNDWCTEHDNPRYIIDLIKRVTTVSVETVRMVDTLPQLAL
jgi:predicted helicase